jgi:hypothetical protein
VLPRARWSCFFVQPETLLRWHRRPAVLHLVSTRHAAAANLIRYQIAKASSSNATARRKVTGSSTASS